ncbi:MAG: hypothetical protein HY940_02895 [Gammaproteobacteria bacterium]|nr:hypothetical protein [Gammaproteobacteria bacterium]
MRVSIKLMVLIGMLAVLAGCATTTAETGKVDQLTVGTVQREIKLGMASAEVVEVLGSPNIVTTDDERNEVWVYDKVSTNVSRSSSSVGVWLLVFGAGSSSASSSRSQQTLTIVIKFDANKKVRDFSYHTSRF